MASAQPLLTLDDALRASLENNRAYRISVLDARAAANRVSWGAAGALPKVDATGAYARGLNDTRVVLSDSTRPPQVKNGAVSSTGTAGVTGTWEIFSGFSSLAAHTRLETQASLADLQREGERQGLAADVITAYGEVVRQKSLFGALDSAVAFSQERAKLTQGKYGIGTVSKLDLLQAQIDLNEDLSARLRQGQALGDSKRTLNLILSRPDTTAFDVSDSIPLMALPPYESLRAAALEGSPQVLQAAAGERLARASLREYTGGLFPKLDLNAGYNYAIAKSQVGTVRSNESLGWTYGAGIRFNLFDGLQLPDDYRNARITVTRAELQSQDARAQVEKGLADAYAGYRSSLDILRLEASNQELARENVVIAMERMRLGTITSLELRTAQEKFVDAESRLVSARFDSKRAETELLRLAGRLLAASP